MDIVIDTINRRTGGGTKYINQRDEEFLHAAFAEENYRKQFTDALRDCVDMGNFKYPLYTDRIYVSIFRENAQEYRKILTLQSKEHVRSTLYTEILGSVAAYECGFADILRDEYSLKAKSSIRGKWMPCSRNLKAKPTGSPFLMVKERKGRARPLRGIENTNC